MQLENTGARVGIVFFNVFFEGLTLYNLIGLSKKHTSFFDRPLFLFILREKHRRLL